MRSFPSYRPQTGRRTTRGASGSSHTIQRRRITSDERGELLLGEARHINPHVLRGIFEQYLVCNGQHHIANAHTSERRRAAGDDGCDYNFGAPEA